MLVTPSGRLGRQQVIDRRHEILVATRANLDHRYTGGGVRDEDGEQAISAISDKSGHIGSDIEDLDMSPGVDSEFLADHPGRLRDQPSKATTTSR